MIVWSNEFPIQGEYFYLMPTSMLAIIRAQWLLILMTLVCDVMSCFKLWYFSLGQTITSDLKKDFLCQIETFSNVIPNQGKVELKNSKLQFPYTATPGLVQKHQRGLLVLLKVWNTKFKGSILILSDSIKKFISSLGHDLTRPKNQNYQTVFFVFL